MIRVTGASGTRGSEVVRQLESAKAPFRGAYFSNELSKAHGRPICHINLSPSDLKTGMLAVGMPEEIADRMLGLERYFREGRANLVTDDIKQVTGREPRHIAEFVWETARTGIWEVDAGGATR